MSDPAPIDESRAIDTLGGRARDARVEQLLLAGLDHYFAGNYDQAVHVWTRVLFLDRGHARARAYIERARSALAERQRESEELLHRGTTAFEHGQVDAARQLLTAAVEQGAAPDVALAYLGRIDRLEPVPQPDIDPEPSQRNDPHTSRQNHRVRWRRLYVVGGWTVAAALGTASALWFAGSVLDLARWRPTRASAPSTASPPPGDGVPVPRASDVAVSRARALYMTGHARDAIRLLETIAVGDPNRAEADRVLAEIQRTLLTAADPSSTDTMTPVP